MQISTLTMPEALSRLQKHIIGSDNFFNLSFDNAGFPPYNVEKLSQYSYKISFALAGYSRGDISVTVEGSNLVIEGKRPPDLEERDFIHQGIAERDFRREFRLMNNTSVKSCEMKDGMLFVFLEYELPETLKPRKLDIA